MTVAETIYEEIRGVCIQMARVMPLRLRVVKGEQDTSTEPQPEAQEFLKFDEQRVGRDFKLYGFMAEATSVQFAACRLRVHLAVRENSHAVCLRSGS